MIDINYLAVAGATLAAFVVSSVWYIVFDTRPESTPAAGTTRPEPWKILVELVRSLVVAVVLAGLVAELEIIDWTGAVLLAVSLWIAFPVVLLAGSVIWESVAPRVAAIHAGDWLVKLLVMAQIVGI